MGWNDHVELVRMQCLDCGDVDDWEIWDRIALERYGNELGKKLGHDVEEAGKCPACGSKRGEPVDPDGEGIW